MRRTRGTALGSALAIGLAASPAPAAPPTTRPSIELPAGRLTDALAALAAQTGVSIGAEGPIPDLRVPAVRGRMSVEEALARLLGSADMRAIRTGPNDYRLTRAYTRSTIHQPIETSPPADIVVTGRKLAEPLGSVPAPLAVYVPSEDERAPTSADAHTVTDRIGGLSVTNFGAGRDRLFLRAIADSPFNGFSQTAVSVQLDDTRVTYDAPEPGLRLVDVERVEVLKGPQGPLYGTGALGGVYRIVTNRPTIAETSLVAVAGSSATTNGGAGASAQLVANLPIAGDRAAVRVVGYASADPGWADHPGVARDTNQTYVRGVRVGLRVAPIHRWTLDLSAVAQSVDARDADYVDRDSETLSRASTSLEPHEVALVVFSGTLTGAIGELPLTIATGKTRQSETSLFDASAASTELGVVDARTYRDRRAHDVFDQEVRLASAPGEPIEWVAGASYLSASTRASGDLATAGATIRDFFRLHRNVSEAALYGNASVPLAPRLRGEIGARLFRNGTEDERTAEEGTDFTARTIVGMTPSASISYRPTVDSLVFLRAASAFRPGGVDPANTRSGRYDADEVRTVDLGTRLTRGPWRIEPGLFGSAWLSVQSDYLRPDGLVATRNAGDAHVVGGEFDGSWKSAGWSISAGATYQRGRLIRLADGADLPDDRRLPVVPDVTGRFKAKRSFPVGRATISPYASGNYVGPARLSFDEGLDRKTPGYAEFGAGVELAFERLAARLDVANLLDARADTFAFGNPFSIRTTRQYTPLRPRTVAVSFSTSF